MPCGGVEQLKAYGRVGRFCSCDSILSAQCAVDFIVQLRAGVR
jgi:hypothetical protein